MRLGSCPLGDQETFPPATLWSLPCPGLCPRRYSPTLSGTHLLLLPTHLLTDPPCPQNPRRHLLTGLGWPEGVSQLASVPAGTEGPQRDLLLAQNRHRKTHRENKEGLD